LLLITAPAARPAAKPVAPTFLGLRWGPTPIACHASLTLGALVGASGCIANGLKKWSGWRDSNPRPPDPQSGALARLRYIPISGELSSS
jgi:hypothetical protein